MPLLPNHNSRSQNPLNDLYHFTEADFAEWLRSHGGDRAGVPDEEITAFFANFPQEPPDAFVGYFRSFAGLSVPRRYGREYVEELHLLRPDRAKVFLDPETGEWSLYCGYYRQNYFQLRMTSDGSLFHFTGDLARGMTLASSVRSLLAKLCFFDLLGSDARYRFSSELVTAPAAIVGEITTTFGLRPSKVFSDDYNHCFVSPNAGIYEGSTGAIAGPRRARRRFIAFSHRDDVFFRQSIESALEKRLEPHLMFQWKHRHSVKPTTAVERTPADSFRCFSHIWLSRYASEGLVSPPPNWPSGSDFFAYLTSLETHADRAIRYVCAAGLAAFGKNLALIESVSTRNVATTVGMARSRVGRRVHRLPRPAISRFSIL